MSLVYITAFNGIADGHSDDNGLDGRIGIEGIGESYVGDYGRFGRGVRVEGERLYQNLDDGQLGAELTTVRVGLSLQMVASAVGTATCPVLVLRAGSGWDAVAALFYDYVDHQFVLAGPEPTYTPYWSSGADTYPIGAWHFVEMRLTCDDAAGTITLKIDGTQVFTDTAIDTQGGAADPDLMQVAICERDPNDFTTKFAVFYLDLFYVTSADGAAPHNGFLGNVRGDAVFPTADGSVTEWTPSASTNASCVDDGNAPDDDTTYTHTAATEARDLFAHTTYSAPDVGLVAAQVCMTLRQEVEDGTRLTRVVVKSPDEEVLGTEDTFGTDYDEMRMVTEFAGDEFATVAALNAYINAFEIGYEVTA